MSRTLFSLAGFQVIISGRFWVIAEDTLPLLTEPRVADSTAIIAKSLRSPYLETESMLSGQSLGFKLDKFAGK
jgi:hypothetical protein